MLPTHVSFYQVANNRYEHHQFGITTNLHPVVTKLKTEPSGQGVAKWLVTKARVSRLRTGPSSSHQAVEAHTNTKM